VAAAGEIADDAFDMSAYLEVRDSAPDDAGVQTTCRAMADAIRRTGILVVRDPRVSADDNKTFQTLMQRYYSQSVDDLIVDARPELLYQVGVTPDMKETAICATDPDCHALIEQLAPEDRPHIPTGPDPKWRFFWRVGERPAAADTKFAELNAPPVVPPAFQDEWKSTMDGWGDKLLEAVSTVAEMIAIGWGQPRDVFTSRMHRGPHLLAPTGSDLSKYNSPGTIFAGWHTDVSFLTIHGKSNFPGLSVWTREGKKIGVSVPDGYLLVQAGQQLEYLTGGHVKAGYHEVILSEGAQTAAKRAIQAGESLWRISSTVFAHINSDCILEPVLQSDDEESFPPVQAGAFVAAELEKIFAANRPESNGNSSKL
jgi:isopenicillin N synthase-like dioxygenase